MTDKEKDSVKEKILSEIEAVKNSIIALEDTVKPVSPDNAIGRLTRMEAINAKSIREASLRSLKVKLTKLNRALSRIDDPDFGVCIQCEEPIPVKRILLMPESALCVSCADR
jgi:DnaK suppressor protein